MLVGVVVLGILKAFELNISKGSFFISVNVVTVICSLVAVIFIKKMKWYFLF